MQEKLNQYLGFIESGELLETYPDAQGRPVRIDVYFQYQPPDEATQFLGKAEATIQNAGVTFEWRVLAA